MLNSNTSVDASPGANLQFQINELIKSLIYEEDISAIRQAGHHLVNTVHNFCSKVNNGTIKVDSNALLNAIKNVTCIDITRQLNSPNLDRKRIIRDLRLFSNTVRYVLNPK